VFPYQWILFISESSQIILTYSNAFTQQKNFYRTADFVGLRGFAWRYSRLHAGLRFLLVAKYQSLETVPQLSFEITSALISKQELNSQNSEKDGSQKNVNLSEV